MTGTAVYLPMLTNALSSMLGRPVVNESGLDRPFNGTPAASGRGDRLHRGTTGAETGIEERARHRLGHREDSKTIGELGYENTAMQPDCRSRRRGADTG